MITLSQSQPFASYNYGAKNKERLIEAIKKAILFTTAYGLIISFIFTVIPHLVISIITQDLSLINIGKNIIRAYALSMPILGVSYRLD